MPTPRERMLLAYGFISVDNAAAAGRLRYVVQAAHEDGHRWVNVHRFPSKVLAEEAIRRAMAAGDHRRLRVRPLRETDDN